MRNDGICILFLPKRKKNIIQYCIVNGEGGGVYTVETGECALTDDVYLQK
jgi:hypothetical protein